MGRWIIGRIRYNIQRFHFRTLVHELEQYQAQEQDEQSEQEEDGDEMEM